MRIIKSNKGQSALETAVILPFILFILFAVISLGIYIYDHSVLLLAANKATDTGIGILSIDDMSDSEKEIKIEEAARNFVNSGIFLEEPDASDGLPELALISEADENGERKLSVTVIRRFNCGLPFVNDIFRDKMIIKAQSTYIFKEH